MEKNYKILEISPFTLSLPLDGGKVVISERIKNFSDFMDISLISMNTHEIGNMDENYPNLKDIKIYKPLKYNKFVNIVKWLISSKPKLAINYYNKEYKKEIMEYIIKNKIDIVILEFPYTAEFIDIKELKNLGIRIIVIAHGVEEIFFEKLRKDELPSAIVKYEKQRWNHYEKLILNSVDKVIGIAPEDVVYLKTKHKLNNIVYLPPYLNKETKCWMENENSNYIVFCGSLSFYPNYHGIKWFLDEVCKGNLKTLGKKVILKITGKISREMREEFKAYKEVEFTGYLSDEELEKLILNAKCAIVPILIGSGIKIKLLKSLSYGIPTVITNHAASGVPFNNEKPYYKCDNSKEFFYYLKEILNNRDLRLNLSKRAKSFYEEVYSSDKNKKMWIENIIK